MNGAYQIINFDDIEFETGEPELVNGAYKKITDTEKRFVITHLNLDEETYKDIQLTFENVEGTFVGTGVVNGKLAVVSIASTDQVTVSLNDITGGITTLQNALAVTDAKFNYSTTEQVVGTWIDGKPLYRKVISTNITNATTILSQDVFPDTNIVKNISGYVGQVENENEVGSIPIGSYFSTGSFISVYQWRGETAKGLTISCSSAYVNCPIIIIVEYTKTTDTPPTP